MSEKNSFSNIQRRNSAVMAKYEWTSSLMNMQKSGHEIHDRRIKTHRKANEFLQGLLQKRSDGSLLDDNGTIDRYEKFLKYKSNFNDDDLLNEFDRRLRALNKDRRHKRSIPIDSNISQEIQNDIQSLKSTDQKRAIPIDLQISQETETDIQSLTPNDRVSQLNRNLISSNIYRLNQYQNQRLHRIIVYYQIYLRMIIQLIFVLIRINIHHHQHHL